MKGRELGRNEQKKRKKGGRKILIFLKTSMYLALHIVSNLIFLKIL